MSTTDNRESAEVDVHDLVQKLQGFGRGLNSRQQQILSAVLERGLGMDGDVQGYTFANYFTPNPPPITPVMTEQFLKISYQHP